MLVEVDDRVPRPLNCLLSGLNDRRLLPSNCADSRRGRAMPKMTGSHVSRAVGWAGYACVATVWMPSRLRMSAAIDSPRGKNASSRVGL